MGPDHEWVGIYYQRLAACYYELERYDDALVHATKQLEFHRRVGPESPAMGSALRMCGEILFELGRLEEAKAYQEQCLELRERILEPGHWHIESARGLLARTLAAQGRFAEAEPVLLAAYEAMTPPPPLGDYKANLVEWIIDLYDGWHDAEPSAGHDAGAAEWRARLDEYDVGTDP